MLCSAPRMTTMKNGYDIHRFARTMEANAQLGSVNHGRPGCGPATTRHTWLSGPHSPLKNNLHAGAAVELGTAEGTHSATGQKAVKPPAGALGARAARH